MSINLLMTRAIKLALVRFWGAIRNNHVLVRTDNISVKAYINKQSGSNSLTLCTETAQLMCWSEWNLKSISAEPTNSHQNELADWLSRQQLDHNEWSLKADLLAFRL